MEDNPMANLPPATSGEIPMPTLPGVVPAHILVEIAIRSIRGEAVDLDEYASPIDLRGLQFGALLAPIVVMPAGTADSGAARPHAAEPRDPPTTEGT